MPGPRSLGAIPDLVHDRAAAAVHPAGGYGGDLHAVVLLRLADSECPPRIRPGAYEKEVRELRR